MLRMTQQLERVFKENPLYSKDGQGKSAKVIAKFYLPGTSFQWLITEASLINGHWILYGYCYIFRWEWGNVFLEEILNTMAEVDIFEEKDQKSVYELE